MEYCLITGEPLDESPLPRAYYIKFIGGITSKRVTSFDFNHKCGNDVDSSLVNVFKHIFVILAPTS